MRATPTPAGALRRLLLLMLLFTGLLPLRAQSDPQLTQYWALPNYYNPAAAASSDFLRIRGDARLQWLGIHNAPKSFLGTVEMPVKLLNKRIGLGASFTSETLGLFSNMTAGVQANYRLDFKKRGYLAIGIQAGFFNSSFKGSEVYIPDDDEYHTSSDPSIPTQDLTGTAFDLGLGAWYVHPLFTVGVSGQHLLKPSVSMRQEGSSETAAQEYKTELGRMAYLMAIGNIELKNTLFLLQPSLLVKTDFGMVMAEVTARATYNRFFFAALGWRVGDAVTIAAGVEVKNFFFGYSYDYPTSAIGKASSGSHELVAGYQLKLDLSGKNRNRHRAVRIM